MHPHLCLVLAIHHIVAASTREPRKDAHDLLEHVYLDLPTHVCTALGTLGVVLADVPVATPLLVQARRPHLPLGQTRLAERVAAMQSHDCVLRQWLVTQRTGQGRDQRLEDRTVSTVACTWRRRRGRGMVQCLFKLVSLKCHVRETGLCVRSGL
jgi:hypothetical protein